MTLLARFHEVLASRSFSNVCRIRGKSTSANSSVFPLYLPGPEGSKIRTVTVKIGKSGESNCFLAKSAASFRNAKQLETTCDWYWAFFSLDP